MIPRDPSHTLTRLAAGYPVLAVTGPRQSGKTTLCRALFPELPNQGLPANLSFWRDRAGHEVDLLIECDNRLRPVEIKAGPTITADASRGLLRWIKVAGDAAAEPTLVYAGEQAQTRQSVRWTPWRELQPQVLSRAT